MRKKSWIDRLWFKVNTQAWHYSWNKRGAYAPDPIKVFIKRLVEKFCAFCWAIERKAKRED